MELLGQRVWTFLRLLIHIAKLPSRKVETIYTPTSSVWECPLSHPTPSPTLGIIILFNICHFDSKKWCLILICICLIGRFNFFFQFSIHLHFFFNNHFMSFIHFSTGVFVFFLLTIKAFYILNVSRGLKLFWMEFSVPVHCHSEFMVIILMLFLWKISKHIFPGILFDFSVLIW